MQLPDDDRAVSAVIGAILIFGIAVIGFTTYQATVVPQENRQVEFNHYSEVQEDMEQLGTKAVSVAGSDLQTSQGISLGTTYPARAAAINPGPPAGQLRKTNDGDSFSSSVSDVCGGTATFGIQYVPNYNELDGQPIVYENGQVFVQGDGQVAFLDTRQVINANTQTITLYRLAGDIPTSASIANANVELQGSEIYGKTTLNSQTTITVPSQLDKPQWENNLVAGSFSGSFSNSASGVDITVPSEYTLKCYAVGFGSTSPPPESAYNGTAISSGNRSDGTSDSGVGTSGVSTYPNPSQATISAKGGIWQSISSVDAIVLDNPRFSPTRPGDGDTQKDKRHLRTVFGIRGDSDYPRYYMDLGGKKGLQYQAGETQWQDKEITIIKEEQDGATTEYTTKIDGTELSPPEFTSGETFNLLGLSKVEASSTSSYATVVREIRDLLRTSSNAELFVADHHGRVRTELTDVNYPSEGGGGGTTSASKATYDGGTAGATNGGQNFEFDFSVSAGNSVTVQNASIDTRNMPAGERVDLQKVDINGGSKEYNGPKYDSDGTVLDITDSTVSGSGSPHTVVFRKFDPNLPQDGYSKTSSKPDSDDDYIIVTLGYADGSQDTFYFESD